MSDSLRDLPVLLPEAEALSETVSKASKEPVSINEKNWVEWWNSALRFKRLAEFANERLENVAGKLSNEGAEAALSECSIVPSLSCASRCVSQLDSGSLKVWNKWCSSELFPEVDIELFPAQAVKKSTGSKANSTGFRRFKNWRMIETAFKRVGRQSKADAVSDLRGIMAESGDSREWCSVAIAACERLLYLGVAKADPTGNLDDILDSDLPKALSKEVEKEIDPKRDDEGWNDRALSPVYHGGENGILPGKVAGACSDDTGLIVEKLLLDRDKEVVSICTEEAEECLSELKVNQGNSRKVSFTLFERGVNALSEARYLSKAHGLSLGQTDELQREYASFREKFLKLRRLEHLSADAESYVSKLKKVNLRNDSDEKLAERLLEVKNKATKLLSSYNAVEAYVTGKDGKSKKDIDERGYGAAEKRIRVEIDRRKLIRVIRVASVALVLGTAFVSWYLYDGAKEEAERRSNDLAALVEVKEFDEVKLSLEDADATSGIAGLFKRIGKWKEESTKASDWLVRQSEIAERLVALNEEISSKREKVAGLPGISTVEPWEDVLQGWEELEGLLAAGRAIDQEMSTDIGREASEEFHGLNRDWKGFRRQNHETLEGSIDGVFSELSDSIAQGESNRDRPDIPGLLDAFRGYSNILDNISAILGMVEGLSGSVPFANDSGEEYGELASAHKEESDLIEAGLALFQQNVATLNSASGLPTHLRAIENLKATPMSVENFLPDGIEIDIEGLTNALDGLTQFSELIFVDPEKLKALKDDPPAPSLVKSDAGDVMFELQDDWKLSDIYEYRSSAGRPIEAFSRGMPEVKDRSGNSLSMQVDAYILKKSSKEANFETYSATRTASGGGSRMTGEFPPGKPARSRESEFFSRLSLGSVYDESSQSFRDSLLFALDNVITKASEGVENSSSINVVFLTFLHLKIGEVLLSDEEGFAADITSFRADYESLTSLRAENLPLELESGDWMIPGVYQRWKNVLESYYAGKAERSYVQEYRKNSKILRSLASSGFEYAGYVGVDRMPHVSSDVAKAGAKVWGVRPHATLREMEAAPVFEPTDDGEFSSINRVALFSPLFFSSPQFDSFMNEVDRSNSMRAVLRIQR